MSEPLCGDFSSAAEDMYRKISQTVERGEKYAILGHSMGALLAYEVTVLIQQSVMQQPDILFLSGRCPPHIVLDEPLLHDQSDREILEHLFKFDSIPEELLVNQELQKVFLPILKMDYKILADYKPSSTVVKCPIRVLGGIDDVGVKESHLSQWQEYTTGPFKLHMLEGDHFFIYENSEAVMKLVSEQLEI